MTIDAHHLATMLYKARRHVPKSIIELKHLHLQPHNPWPDITQLVLSIDRQTVYPLPDFVRNSAINDLNLAQFVATQQLHTYLFHQTFNDWLAATTACLAAWHHNGRLFDLPNTHQGFASLPAAPFAPLDYLDDDPSHIAENTFAFSLETKPDGSIFVQLTTDYVAPFLPIGDMRQDPNGTPYFPQDILVSESNWTKPYLSHARNPRRQRYNITWPETILVAIYSNPTDPMTTVSILLDEDTRHTYRYAWDNDYACHYVEWILNVDDAVLHCLRHHGPDFVFTDRDALTDALHSEQTEFTNALQNQLEQKPDFRFTRTPDGALELETTSYIHDPRRLHYEDYPTSEHLYTFRIIWTANDLRVASLDIFETV